MTGPRPRWQLMVLLIDGVISLLLSIMALVYGCVGLIQHSAFHCAAAAMFAVFSQWRLSPDSL